MHRDDIEKRFTYHPPLPGQPALYEVLRQHAKQFAHLICTYTPESREQSLAITALEESVMWANAAIARSGFTIGHGTLDQAMAHYEDVAQRIDKE